MPSAENNLSSSFTSAVFIIHQQRHGAESFGQPIQRLIHLGSDFLRIERPMRIPFRRRHEPMEFFLQFLDRD